MMSWIIGLSLLLIGRTDIRSYTTVGNIRLTISNFGMIGTGFNPQLYLPDGTPQPSMEYPARSRTEHLYRAGLWVGAVDINGDTLVSTGAVDAYSTASAGQEGFEFFPTDAPEDTVIEKSILLTSPFYDPTAVSEQDFYAVYYDNRRYVPNHTPLNLKVIQRSYAWSYEYIDDVVIVSFTIVNIGAGDLTHLYVGLYAELVTGNRDFWGDQFARTPFYQHKRLFFVDSLRLVYERNDGYDYLATSLAGIKLLGLEQHGEKLDPDSFTVSFNWWRWQDMTGAVSDSIRYVLLSNGERDPDVDDAYVAENEYPDPISMISIGPIPFLPPGDSVTVVFAFVGGENPQHLLENAGWAQRAYEADYVLPAPPPSPRLVAIPQSRKVILYFDNSPENARDPAPPHLRDFEGYRIYRSTTGIIGDTSWVLLAQFDKTAEDTSGDVPHGVGYNNGMPPVETEGAYAGWYRFEDVGVKNGFKYYYAVTSFDVGNPDIGLPPLESSLRQNLIEVIPGTPPTSAPEKEVGVYPNPYRLSAIWDQEGERGRKIYFYNLPRKCTIYIYNLAGDLVKVIHHEDPYRGEAEWNLITDNEQAIATGLYLFAVVDEETGRVKRGRFLVIK